MSLPGLATNVTDMVVALERIAGKHVTDRIKWEIDPAVVKIVNSWPGNFATTRADEMGFKRDVDFDAIITAYIEDELQGIIPA